MNTQPPRQQQSSQKKTLFIVLGIVSFLIVCVVIGFSVLMSLWNGNSASDDEYSKSYSVVEDQKKTFSTDETIEFGYADITIQSIERDYVPTSTEQAYLDESEVYWAGRREKDTPKPEDHLGWTIPDARYVKIQADVSYNAQNAALVNDIAYTGGSWLENTLNAELDGRDSVMTYVNDSVHEGNGLDYSLEQAITGGETLKLTYIFRVPASTGSASLAYKQVVYKKTSSLVGTEGMPSELFEYKVTAW